MRKNADRSDMNIGKLKSVPLREVWKKEDADFSSWLAENLDGLNDAVGLNLEISDTEHKVDDSNYKIDILCEDDEGQSVIIENQLEKTDHIHLGQILTYLVNMEAAAVIWIAKEARQEHINVINWLNETTDKNFYLVVVEAYRIDNSDPAPFFSVICKPSREVKNLGSDKKVIQAERNSRRHRKAAADTIIVPARKEGFDEVFLGDNCWWSIRIKESKIPELKYIAGYQVAPMSAITHVAKIKLIVESEVDPGKYKVIFDGPAKQIKSIALGKTSKIQGPAYCEYTKLNGAKNIDDLLDDEGYEQKKVA
jgi:hypothetical protein